MKYGIIPLKELIIQYDETSFKPVIMYDYQKTLSGDHTINFLNSFSGYLECDGFSGYRRMDRLIG